MDKFDYLDIFKEILKSIENCEISFKIDFVIEIVNGIYTLNIWNSSGGIILPIEDRLFKSEFNTFTKEETFIKNIKVEIKNNSLYYTGYGRLATFTTKDCNTNKYGWKGNSLEISDFEKQMINDMYNGNFYQVIEKHILGENNE